MVHPFKQTPHVQACRNCWCMVCDVRTSACADWTTHCNATYGDSKWRALREQLKKAAEQSGAKGTMGGAGSHGSANAVNTSTATTTASTGCSSAGSSSVKGSCSDLLRQVEQVWPCETPAPPGMVVAAFRPYQKQSLSFMLSREQAKSSADTVVGSGDDAVRGGWYVHAHARTC